MKRIATIANRNGPGQVCPGEADASFPLSRFSRGLRFKLPSVASAHGATIQPFFTGSTVQRCNERSFMVSPHLSRPIRTKPDLFADNFPRSRRVGGLFFFLKTAPKNTQKQPNSAIALVVSEMQLSAENAHFVSARSFGVKHSQTTTCKVLLCQMTPPEKNSLVAFVAFRYHKTPDPSLVWTLLWCSNCTPLPKMRSLRRGCWLV